MVGFCFLVVSSSFFFLACKISIHKARQPGVLSVRDKHLLSLPALFDR